MKKCVVDLRTQVPLLDIASFGRGGGCVLTPALREQIARTAGRTPEVMIKVSGGSRNLTGVGRLSVVTDCTGALIGLIEPDDTYPSGPVH